MAKKIINRKELRDDYDSDLEDEDHEGEGEENEAERHAEESTKGKPRSSRKKSEKKVRLKAFWGVLNQSLKKVAQFEYHERAQAQKRAEELSASQKTPHFVRIIKEEIS